MWSDSHIDRAIARKPRQCAVLRSQSRSSWARSQARVYHVRLNYLWSYSVGPGHPGYALFDSQNLVLRHYAAVASGRRCVRMCME